MDLPFKPHIQYFFLVVLFMASCQTGTEPSTPETPKKPVRAIDLQGHRGARGDLPENSIPGFIYALEQGVTTLEMDVVISKDGQVVVSHDPVMNDKICLNAADKEHRIYEMTYREVMGFDCGSLGNKRFPDQKKMSTFKPTLAMVIDTIEALVNKHGKPGVMYNIETKSKPEGDGIYHPAPDSFALLLNNVINAKGIKSKVTIQSFDVRTLQAYKQLAPDMPLVLLVEDTLSYEWHIAELGFKPEVYSPYYPLVDSQLVQMVHADSMKLVPWTVNDSITFMNLLNLGVDGVITDYPRMGKTVVEHYQNQ